jgi:glycosyltransferase involved in cell wall biosynthesis
MAGSPSGGIGSALARLKFLAAGILKHRPRFVIIPTGDGLAMFLWMLAPLLLLRRVRVACVLHRLRFGYDQGGRRGQVIRMLNYLSILLARRVDFFSVDEVPVKALADGFNPCGLEVERMPDPLLAVESGTKEEARRRLGLPSAGKLLGCLGVIDERKGALEMLKVAADLPADCYILLAGRFSPAVEAEAQRVSAILGDRLICMNRFLEEGELFDALVSLDGMVLLQRGHIGISSFALHAMRVGVPVFCAGTPWFKLMHDQFPGALAINHDPAAVLDEMASWVRDVAGSKGAASAIERHFSKEQFCKVLRDFIRAQEGLRLSARKEQAQAPSQP